MTTDPDKIVLSRKELIELKDELAEATDGIDKVSDKLKIYFLVRRLDYVVFSLEDMLGIDTKPKDP